MEQKLISNLALLFLLGKQQHVMLQIRHGFGFASMTECTNKANLDGNTDLLLMPLRSESKCGTEAF